MAVDTLPSPPARLACNPAISGNARRRPLHTRTSALLFGVGEDVEQVVETLVAR